MGKKNRIKHLLGRFNMDTNCEIKALPYFLGDVVCELLIKIDLNHANSLAIANVPYYIDEGALKKIFASLGIDIAEVNLTASTSLHGNLKRGYRSGRLVFPTIQSCRRAFDSINGSMCPFKLGNFDANLPAWHKPVAIRHGKRKCVAAETEGMEIQKDMEANEKVDNDQADEDGWVTVTRKHRHSFRGKINRLNENHADNEGAEVGRSTDWSHESPKKKKRKD